MIGVFASEYVPASFDDVCRLLDRSTAPMAHLRITRELTRRSATVAAMEIEWAQPSAPDDWRGAELRIIRAQSGTTPLTELLLVARSPVAADGARRLLEGLVERLQVDISAITASGRQPLRAG